jgi:hypothetical protein
MAEMEASLAVNGPLFQHAEDAIRKMFKSANNVNNSRLLIVKIHGFLKKSILSILFSELYILLEFQAATRPLF